MASVLAVTKSENARILEVLLKGPTSKQDLQQALLYASQHGLRDCVRILLKGGADPNVSTKSGDCPLHQAVSEGHSHVIGALIEGGASLHVKGSGNNTVVHIACMWGRDECLKLLIDYNCDVNCRDSSQNTPLILSVKGKHYECIRLLLTARCDVNAKDSSGRTALHYASLTATAVQQLIQAGVDVNIHDADGCSPLIYAAAEGLERVITCLVQTPHCDVNIANSCGKTPLHILSYKGHARSVQELMHHGAQPGIRDVELKTAMWYAVANGHSHVVRVLLVNMFNKHYFQCSPNTTVSAPCPTQLAIDKELPLVVLQMFIMTCYDNYHVRACLQQQKARDLFSDSMEWFTQGQQIPSLQQMCRQWIRHYMRGEHASLNTSHLPLPKKLIDFIWMKELDD